MSTAVILSKSKTEVEFQYGGRFGEFSGMSSQSHVPHCRVKEFHPPYWKSFFAIFYFLFVFVMQFGLWPAAASYRLRYTCLTSLAWYFRNFCLAKYTDKLNILFISYGLHGCLFLYSVAWYWQTFRLISAEKKSDKALVYCTDIELHLHWKFIWKHAIT